MSLGWQTGRTCTRPCDVCGVSMEHREQRVNTHPDPWWKPAPHRAPCGAWCMGGGIGSAQTRDGDRISLSDAVKASHRREVCGTAGCCGGVS